MPAPRASRAQRGQRLFNYVLEGNVWKSVCRRFNDGKDPCGIRDPMAPCPSHYLHICRLCCQAGHGEHHVHYPCTTDPRDYADLPHSPINARGPVAHEQVRQGRRRAR